MALLVAYASPNGSTAEMAEVLVRQLRGEGYTVDLAPVETLYSISSYKALILGAPIQCGTWLRSIYQFRYRARIPEMTLPIYSWMTCMRVLEEGGYEHARERYTLPQLRHYPALRSIEIFAGKIIPERLTWQELALFRENYDGLEDITYVQGDHREWERFAEWGRFILKDLKELNILPM